MPSIFTQIVEGRIPSHRIRENDRFLAFLDIRPVNPGHTLVIPKVEVDHFFALSDDLLAEILVFARPISEAIQRVTGAARIGAVVAGFDVPHAHLHLIPVNSMAELTFERARPASQEDLAAMARKIREALPA
ncbi:histidine triad (HIT) protein [Sulfobacillus acidophilus TPY]|jgi:histidine triad (HIT) family protein|uniref:Histidine triad (HIT) protein n=1 Tax=Sulfobacillus acidophilus (strain ATCC 700253 / DSM 10332 / NAL) TaxID=679936 RepID=G8TSG2_SULAD|nr:histidine triad (HIT) protein [Sulfobacillus acidophilus TPY]AEW06654.1 histidine triad (HIT) protein [Sulfobacillus acidophilus DSM 10332]